MDDLEKSISAHEQAYPQGAALARALLGEAEAIFSGQLRFLLNQRGDEFWPLAERLAGYSKAFGSTAANSLIEYTVSYLKEQALFIASKEYSNKTFNEAREKVYDNPDVMERFYLEGLMLTHAFWPIHLDIHAFFAQSFMPLVPENSFGTEFGYGHGLYLLDILQARAKTRCKGFDISKYSQQYASRLFSLAGIERSRFSWQQSDVRETFPAGDGEFSWAVFAEVLEHIPDPYYSLTELRRCLKVGSPAFLTTVLFSNALDHLYQFKSVEDVRDMIRGAKFSITAEKTLKVTDYGNSRDPSVDVVFVCKAT